MERKRKIVAFEINDVTKVVEQADQMLDNATKDKTVEQKGDTQSVSDLQTLNKRNVTEQSGREMFAVFGLDPATYEQYRMQLQNLGMPTRQQQAEFLQEVGHSAMAAGTSIQKVFPVALAAYNRNVGSPEKALAILKLIADEQAKYPGVDLFDIALDSATGNSTQAAARLQPLLLVIAGQTRDHQEAVTTLRKLQQVLIGFTLPSSELGQVLHKDNVQLNKLEQLRELLLTKAALYRIEADIKSKQYVAKIWQHWTKNMPKYVNNPFFRARLQQLQANATSTYLWKSYSDAVGYNGGQGLSTNTPANNTSSPPMGFIDRRSSNDADRIVVAGEGQRPVDLRNVAPPAGGQPGQSGQPAQQGQPGQPAQQGSDPATQSFNTTETANFGQDPNNQAAGLMAAFNKINPQLMGQWRAAHMTATNLKNSVEQNYKTLAQLIQSGDAETFNTPFLQNANGSSGGRAPFATPQQIEAEGIRLSQQAKAAYDAFVKLVQIVQQLMAGASSKVSQYEMSAIAQYQTDIRKDMAAMREMSIRALDMAVLGPVEQEVRVLLSYYDYYKSQIEFGNEALMGVGVDMYVYPFMQILDQVAGVMTKAVQKFKQAAMKFTSMDAAMAQYFRVRAQQIENGATQALNEGLTQVARMANKGSFSLASVEDTKLIKTAVALDELASMGKEAEDEVKEAKPKSVEDYWNDLYGNDPEYGTLIEDAPKHHTDTTDEVHKHRHLKKHR